MLLPRWFLTAGHLASQLSNGTTLPCSWQKGTHLDKHKNSSAQFLSGLPDICTCRSCRDSLSATTALAWKVSVNVLLLILRLLCTCPLAKICLYVSQARTVSSPILRIDWPAISTLLRFASKVTFEQTKQSFEAELVR